MPTSLTEPQRKHLRRLAQRLRPVVRVGQNGLSAPVMAEIERALEHHELIKLSLRLGDRAVRAGAIGRIAEATGAELVQGIGNAAVFFRANPRKQRPLSLPEP